MAGMDWDRAVAARAADPQHRPTKATSMWIGGGIDSSSPDHGQPPEWGPGFFGVASKPNEVDGPDASLAGAIGGPGGQPQRTEPPVL